MVNTDKNDVDSFVCYNSFRTSINRFRWTPLFEEAVNALFDYWCFWIAPKEWTDVSILVFMDQVIPAIDAAKARRESMSKKRSEAGKKWWEAKSKAMMWNQNALKSWDNVLKQNKTEQNGTNRTKQNVDVDVDVDVDDDVYVDEDDNNIKEKEIKEKEVSEEDLRKLIRKYL